MGKSSEYEPIPTGEGQFSSPDGLDEHLRHSSTLHLKSPASQLKILIIIGLIFSNLCSIATVTILLIWTGKCSVSPIFNERWGYTTNKNALLKQVSYYSPYLDRVEIPIKDMQVDGTFLGNNGSNNIFKKAPSPEVDAAWDRLYKFHYLPLSEDEVRKLGKDPRYTVKAPVSWGYGDDVYVSRTDAAHRIHCLNMLRKATYPEHVYPHLRDGEEETRVLWRPHVMHCAHVLLQHLMCTSTLEAVTYNWVEGMRYPQADFSVNKKCTDLEAILEWQQREGVVDLSKHPWMIKDWLDNVPQDASKIPVPEAYEALFEHVSARSEFLFD